MYAKLPFTAILATLTTFTTAVATVKAPICGPFVDLITYTSPLCVNLQASSLTVQDVKLGLAGGPTPLEGPCVTIQSNIAPSFTFLANGQDLANCYLATYALAGCPNGAAAVTALSLSSQAGKCQNKLVKSAKVYCTT